MTADIVYFGLCCDIHDGLEICRYARIDLPLSQVVASAYWGVLGHVLEVERGLEICCVACDVEEVAHVRVVARG